MIGCNLPAGATIHLVDSYRWNATW